MFVELPIIFANNEDDGLDYEELGIVRPERKLITTVSLVNLDRVQVINEETDGKSCVLRMRAKDEHYVVDMTYKDLVRLLKSKGMLL